jgi:galactose-1-phosphate uridylyltransferase
VASVPYSARWPFEVHLYPRRCAGHLGGLADEELRPMMAAIKRVLTTYRNYYRRRFPYMMLFHQAPANSPGRSAQSSAPPARSRQVEVPRGLRDGGRHLHQRQLP